MRVIPRQLIAPTVLIATGVVVSSFFAISPVETRAVFGGPDVALADSTFIGTDLVASDIPDDVNIAKTGDEVAGFIILDSSAALGSDSPLATTLPGRDGLMTYKVAKGETLSSIAAQYGISVNTILWANQDVRANALRIGQEVVILPVSGIVHRVSDGDTVDSIASYYGASADKILKFNKGITKSSLGSLTRIIVPDVKPKGGTANLAVSGLPSYPGYYALPTVGWNWGLLHGNNGVDIANVCGTPIYAAAEGLIVEAVGGWNGGYGRMVVIEHPNNTKTRYAHLRDISVEVGNYVAQGDLIGAMGATGNVHGPTGCHLHFEAVGFKNWLANK